MKIFLRTFFTLLLIISAFICFAYFFWYKPKFKTIVNSHKNTIEKESKEFKKLEERSVSLKQFAIVHNYNVSLAFLIDMGLGSGKNRFFIYDMNKDSVLKEGLVAHGSCDAGFKIDPTFSNKVNSGCSALGRYKIGNAYRGRFGLAYKLYGLDSSNNNAFQRNIVLHSYDCVPEQETNPIPICNSRGCPMVSTGFLNQLNPIIKKSERPILLWIFE